MIEFLQIALRQFGVKEITGKVNEPIIVGYANLAGFKWVNDDETPWCSIFINYCAKISGMERSNSAAARSWLKVGTEISMLDVRPGDIVIFKRGSSSWQGHVGIFISFKKNDIYVLGGNQNNEVNISLYKYEDLLGFRRLKKQT